MKDEFMTIKDAITRYDTTDTTIRKYTVKKFRKKQGNKLVSTDESKLTLDYDKAGRPRWIVSKSYLDEVFGNNDAEKKSKENDVAYLKAIETLENQLNKKDDQLERRDAEIAHLLSRNEDIQNRLLLPPPKRFWLFRKFFGNR